MGRKKSIIYGAMSFLVIIQAMASSYRDIASRVIPSVVTLQMNSEEGPNKDILGSGFFLGPDKIATNYHVIKSSKSGIVHTSGKNSQKIEIKEIVGIDKENDLAIVLIPEQKIKPLELGNSAELQIGDEIFAVGSPMGLEATFTSGIVSSIRELDGQNLIQISAPISLGSSGGPIVNSSGQVVGVTMMTTASGQNLNFAIPVKILVKLNGEPNLHLALNGTAAIPPPKLEPNFRNIAPQGQDVSIPPEAKPQLQSLDDLIVAFSKTCNIGVVESCKRLEKLAERYEMQNEVIAFRNMSCIHGDGDSCGQLATSEEKSGDFDAAAKHYLNGCKNKEPRSCYKMGAIILDKGCKQNDPISCYGLAKHLLQDATDKAKSKKYFKKARDIWNTQCKSGSREACSQLKEFGKISKR